MAEPKPQDDQHHDGDERATEKWERFKDFTKKISRVPKKEVDKEREKRERKKKRAG
jgi:hypothetical protein